jgi:hypothetical protein
MTTKLTGVDDRFTKTEASALDHQNYMEQKIIELKQYFAKANDSIYKLQDFQKESIKFQEKTRTDHAATQKRIESVQANAHAEVQASYERGLEKVRELESGVNRRLGELDGQLRDQDKYMRETIEENSQRLSQMLASSIDGVENFVQGVADELH